ncbi:MAG: MarR family transcriptional regulator [Thermoplasmatota archaeon]
MDLARLRDRTGNTRLLALALLQRHPGTTLSDVARRLGITVQAVSTHARALAADGLLTPLDGAYQVTPKGLQALQDGLEALREVVHGLTEGVSRVESVSAIAKEHLTAGTRVGLFMEDGDLVARADPRGLAASQGHAQTDCTAGQEVVVRGLAGIVDLEPGRITLVSLPAPAEGGVARVHRARLAEALASRPADRVAAVGTGAQALASERGRVDLAFAADHAAFNAAERGLDVHLFVTRDRLSDVLQVLERLNDRTLKRVPVESVEAPEAPEATP